MAPPNRNANPDALTQILQQMLADREVDRTERQANLAVLQQLAQNNQGHANHDHPGSKLKNFQNTNPPVFSKTEEPLDADDWLQTMENNLEVAGLEDDDKVPHPVKVRPDETDTTEKRKERFLNGLHDEMQTVLVNIPFADLEALVDSAIQMEGKLNQANENRKRRMMHQSGPAPPSFAWLKRRIHPRTGHRHRCRARLSEPEWKKPQDRRAPPQQQQLHPPQQQLQPRPDKSPCQPQQQHCSNTTTRPYATCLGDLCCAIFRSTLNHKPLFPGGSCCSARTGSNAIPVAPKDKSTINCYECGVVGHYSKECPQRLAKMAANTTGPAQQNAVSQQQEVRPNNPNNRSVASFI
ncbi:hypothetical protein QYE76_002897 [Lolium multiflorum]|uniref:CCHC-type domain-containing protein n=1 Tax=Lolium multiflorum TaxID=4521 RepID=A0AAD8RPU5_LOLMU|nr:hypothetical protein QYE76_002897 [Lolium multiflorum]